jgi:hypothetical protein
MPGSAAQIAPASTSGSGVADIGLKDLPPIHRSHPQTTPPEVVDRIKALALEHPAYGCNRLEAML